MDCSLPGFSVHEIFQARILKWVAIFSSRGFSWPGIKADFPVSPAWQTLYPLSHWGKPNIKGKGAVKSFRAGPKFGTFHYLIFHHFWWSLSTMRNVRKDTQPSSSCVPMYNRPKADRVQGKGHSANLYNREVVMGKSENFASWLSKTRGQGSPCLLQRVLKSPVFIFLFFISNRTLYFSLDPWPPS